MVIKNCNVTIANVFSELPRKRGVLIKHNYLVACHTQMECDSMHSSTERKMVNDIFTQRDYLKVLESDHYHTMLRRLSMVKR